MTKNQIEYQKSLEQRRGNLASEELKRQELAEAARHNLVFENETAAHNRAQESLSEKQILSSRDVAYAQLASNRELGYANLGEQQRSNLARELEQNRTNVANEQLKQLGITTTAGTATKQMAVNKAIATMKEDRQDRRTKASLAVEREKTTSGLLNNLANSIVKFLPFK